ncbi:Putative bifunctional amine oxidase [Psilocybe cubensis]|uniref:Amine oxidase domain-containing protein n=2 Tax=Psilocybe cubensis TaxID=181762 RepID=A0A8H7XN64_PSICU|nr:Putative bifunctional amine oxidase [Psilocybe cubensis]KAH9481894.1 Putative bifunctional amine oxidase [Psilocybe cubensis]
MPTSFHSKVAQHIVELELEKLRKRNPSLGYHQDKDKVSWEMLIDRGAHPRKRVPVPDSESLAQVSQAAHGVDPLFPDELPSSLPRSPVTTPETGLPGHKSPADLPRLPEVGITEPVAIIGAGVAGLRIAMMLKHLGIPYRVMEASERYGGRVFTYHFKKQDGEAESTQNYFDVGAMRFPDNAVNARTFELFEELDIKAGGGTGGKLVPYHLGTDDNIMLFNGRRGPAAFFEWVFNILLFLDIKKTVGEMSKNPLEDHFHDGVRNGGTVPDDYINRTYVKPNGDKLYGIDALLGAAWEPYKFLLAKDYKLGWEILMQHDSRSSRAHLLDIMRYPPEVVQWMETRDSGTNAYDDAFTESIIDSLEFDYPTGYDGQGEPGEVNWWCIEGGTEVLTKAMYKSLGIQPFVQTSQRVTAVYKNKPTTPDEKTTMGVIIQGLAELVPTKYSHVVSTIPLSCLRGVDLSRCELDYAQKTALRSLKYGTGVKVGIKFKTRWWQGQNFKKQGGSSKTDRQSRVVVYPSYGVDGPADTPGVLIATYTWNQDAFRFGSLIDPKDWGNSDDLHSASLDPNRQPSPSEAILLQHIYEDLAEIHGETAGWYREQTLDYYAYDWYHNQYSMGGYAFFNAGQFSDLYLHITKPASDGYLHFGGEAASSHHAWVAGALDSAWRCVWEILAKDGTPEQKKKFRKKYGASKEFDNIETAALQYYRGIYANSLEKADGNHGLFHFPGE